MALSQKQWMYGGAGLLAVLLTGCEEILLKIEKALAGIAKSALMK